MKQNAFVGLMAMLMSLSALSIDAVLPALSSIGQALQVTHPNQNQWVIGWLFLGLAVGLMFYGPLSDAMGRKKAIYLGIGIFLVGNLISLFADDLSSMLLGRFCQGLGAASCRVVTVAMIRDRFEGTEMARIMSFIMMLFILVPMLAPLVGQLVLMMANWRMIFLVIVLLGLIGLIWLYRGQEETLAPHKRVPFSFSRIGAGVKETLLHPVSRNYMLAAGIIFGAFVGYLSSIQQIIQVHYGQGGAFAVYFGLLALVIGFSSFMNSRLLGKYTLQQICRGALIWVTLISAVFLTWLLSRDTEPELYQVVLFLVSVFLVVGSLFSNFSALATQPVGHIAGLASSVISAIQTLISVTIGGLIGQAYDGTVVPLVAGFFVCGLVTSLVVFNTPEYLPKAA